MNKEAHDLRLKQLETQNAKLQETVNSHSVKLVAQAFKTSKIEEELEELKLQITTNQQYTNYKT
jgi:uncharacterized coiled-coil protein SlyX